MSAADLPVVVVGFPESSYVRSVRIALHEKGVTCTLEDAEPSSAALLAANPYGRVPVLRHGRVTLFETIAILRYLDRAFAGPALFAVDPVEEARALGYATIVADYLYPPLVRGVILPRLGLAESDAARIAAAAAETDRVLGIVDRTIDDTGGLVGGHFGAADCLVAPLVWWLDRMPEGQGWRSRHARLAAWYDGQAARPSVASTAPALPA